ncbi:glutathione S-transferase family protein [Tabrizicola sp. J26]|uniref:glutathione S-transferase family protein n=1 Tax=Alitabrizicola rongguiensis TaxID=2909234 RepID=UPI001F3713E3|nr:glutathione S-transferase family protein [Tabrizicola rongguiensis]MCF1710138.1 glutathione S-transferase family protein [Tabrizicola rongguiensis]
MTGTVTIWTYDWVPNGPRGHVRDLRLRWAMEEAGIPYAIATVPIADRGPDHVARQPFAQVPFIEDDGVRLFESGACLLHLAEQSEILMPRDPKMRAETMQWIFAALNSVEMVTVPWWYIRMKGVTENPLAGWMRQRFEKLEVVLASRDWLAANRFTAADLLMADVLRIPAKLGQLEEFPALTSYLERVCDRPAFRKAVQDQLDHFEAADIQRKQAGA